MCEETCGACTNNVVAVVESLVTGGNSSVNVDDGSCYDRPYKPFDSLKGCNWLRDMAIEKEFAQYCTEGTGMAYDVCKATCGRCHECIDKDDVTVYINLRSRDCSWLRDNPDEQEKACLKGRESMLERL